MAEPRPGGDPLARLARALSLPALALLVAVMLLPRGIVRWLRVEIGPLNWIVGWLELASAYANLVHVLLFAAVAFLLASRRDLSWRRIGVGLALVGAVTELAQFLVPSRTPRWTDLADDAVGAAIGLLLALLARAAHARWSRPSPQALADAGERGWLAACLRGEAPGDFPGAPDAAVAAARREGVAALVHASLPAGCEPALREAFAAQARIEAARGLAHLAEVRNVLHLVAAAGVDALVLKGTALGTWLYPSPALRACGDLDLLMRSRADADAAIAALVAHGYTLPCPTISGDQVAYELFCLGPDRGDGHSEVDVHWQAINSALYGRVLSFDELRVEAIALPSLGVAASGLSPMHALLHACLHRAVKLASGAGDRLRLLMDLHLLAQRLDTAQWTRLVAIARERGAAGACADGLEAAAVLGVVVPAEILAALDDATRRERIVVPRLRSWFYAQRATAMSLPTWRLRARWLRQRMFPARGYLREYYGESRRGLGAMFGGHLRSGWRSLRGG